jgi:SAM-dependent methyltransferase/polysaccharide pyruvyl transferase WcaK-like protein
MQLDKKALKRLYFYEDYLPKNLKNSLEIGSSIGSFLHLLKLSGSEVTGIEPDPAFADFSEHQYSFPQESKLLEDFKTDKKFDLICSFHVIEHVPDPEDFVKRMKALSAPGGTILHEFPSMELHSWGDLKETYWQPHLQYFNAASVYKLFAKYFKVEKIGYYGSALFVVAKNEEPDYSESEFKSYKRKAAYWKSVIRMTPSLKVKKKINLKEHAFRFFTEKNDYLAKIWLFGRYALKEAAFVRKEKNKGGKMPVQHLTYFRGWENAGDTILSKTVRDSFNSKASIRWQLNKVTDEVTQQRIEQFNQNKLIVIGGGGLFLPDTNKNEKSGWQWPISKEELQQITSPIAVFAVGYNYFPGQTPNELFVDSLNAIVDKAGFVGLRNYGSIEKVKALLRDDLKEKVVFQPCTTTIIRKLEKNLPAKMKTKNVAVNMAFDRYEKRFAGKIYEVLDAVASSMKRLDEQGFNIHLVGHLERDNKFRISLDKFGVNYKEHVLQFMTPNEVYHFYNEMEIVLGMRGHAQMIPFGLNCKIVTLSTHNKMRYFLEDIEAPELLVDLREEVNSIEDRILTAVNLLQEKDSYYQEHFRAKQEEFAQITERNLDQILGLVEK